MRWMPTIFFVAADCTGDSSAGLDAVAVDLACLMRFEAVFVEDSSSPVFTDLAFPLRAARREAAGAWSASGGVLERVFRVGIQFDLVRLDPAARTHVLGCRHLKFPGFYYCFAEESILLVWFGIREWRWAATREDPEIRSH